MQMSLIVATGYILADTPIIRLVLTKLSKIAKTPRQAVLLVTFMGLIASWINYDFGLVVGALMAVYLVKQVPSTNFRLLTAVSYSGYLIWYGELSESALFFISSNGKSFSIRYDYKYSRGRYIIHELQSIYCINIVHNSSIIKLVAE